MILVTKWLVGLAAILLIALLMMSWLQNLHPAIDMISTFRLHILLVLLPLLAIALCFKSWRIALAGLCVSTISLFLTTPYLPGIKPAMAQPNFKVIQFNLLFNNLDTEAAIQVLSQYNPDVFLLQELTPHNFKIAASLKDKHPHQLHCMKGRVGSVAIISRHPINPDFETHCDRFNGLAITQILVGKKPVTVASLHLRWPWPSTQHQQITRIQIRLNDLPTPLILAGDFNATPWTNAVQRVANMTKSHPANGLLLTWAPRFKEFETDIGPVLPIDHILLRGANVTSRKTLADGGSDHFPVLSEIKISN